VEGTRRQVDRIFLRGLRRKLDVDQEEMPAGFAPSLLRLPATGTMPDRKKIRISHPPSPYGI